MIINVQEVSKAYPDAQFTLKGISFDLKAGDCLGLIGQNGTGKSTILKMMNGLVPYDQGNIYYQGQELGSLKPDQKRAMQKEVAYIFQQANLLEGETVLYHLKLVYVLKRQKPDWTAIEETLAFMNLTDLKQVVCRNLSGGQKSKPPVKRVACTPPVRRFPPAASKDAD